MKTAAFSKTYGNRTVLELPELELHRGRICAVVGANGSGKSTMAKVIAGTLKSDKAAAVIENTVSVGYMPQKSYAFRMSARANIRLNGGDVARSEELVARLNLTGLAGNRGDKLSGGETARMALARLMMGTYDLVILDEPTAAMDVESTALAEELIQDYCADTGCALLLVTHSLRQARRLADEAIFLYGGRLWESGSVDEVLFNPQRPETAQFIEFYGM